MNKLRKLVRQVVQETLNERARGNHIDMDLANLMNSMGMNPELASVEHRPNQEAIIKMDGRRELVRRVDGGWMHVRNLNESRRRRSRFRR